MPILGLKINPVFGNSFRHPSESAAEIGTPLLAEAQQGKVD